MAAKTLSLLSLLQKVSTKQDYSVIFYTMKQPLSIF